MVAPTDPLLVDGAKVLFRYLLPFGITFVIAYGVLERLSPFGTAQRRLHILLAAVVGLSVTVFTPGGTSAVVFLSDFLGMVAVVLVGLLLALMAATLLLGEDAVGSAWSTLLAGAAVVTVIAAFVWTGGLTILLGGGEAPGIRATDALALLVVAGAVVLFRWMFGGERG